MKKRIFLFVIFCLICCVFSKFNVVNAEYMPYYDLEPSDLILRSEFSTSFQSSSLERKNNIRLATMSLNNIFVDVGGEFSFNNVVGERTIERGYLNAKIIFNGSFTDGVGGGVCQVSTTLYNAVLLSGLKIIEYHPHSLPVSYIEPSFDAMVNTGSADLRFLNNTKNPIIIKTEYNDYNIRVKIYGEPSLYKFVKESKFVKEIEPLSPKIILDLNHEFPELKKGEQKTLSYAKNGYESEGYLLKYQENILVEKKLIRKDKYGAVREIIMQGT